MKRSSITAALSLVVSVSLSACVAELDAPEDPVVADDPAALDLLKASSEGRHLWSARFGGAGGPRRAGGLVSRSNSLLRAGTFKGLVEFGDRWKQR